MVSKKSLRIAGIIGLCIGIFNFALFASYSNKVNDYESRARMAAAYGDQSDARHYESQAYLYRNSKNAFQTSAIINTSISGGLIAMSFVKGKKEK